jgi:uncharacterized membrane protein
MDHLLKLLAIDAPGGTRLQSAEVHFRGLIPWWGGAILLIGLGALVVYLYMKERARLGTIARLGFAALRIGLISILLFLLCRPVLLAEFSGERPRGVVVLLDNSQSLKQHDRRLSKDDLGRVAIAFGKVAPATPLAQAGSVVDAPKDPSRWAMVEAALKNKNLDLLKNIEKTGPLRSYTFGSSLRQVQDESDVGNPTEALLKKFEANESSTAIADGVISILDSKDGDLPAAIVVISDGRDNASKYSLSEAGAKAASLGVPIAVYGVGSADAGSLRLREVVVPQTVFVDDQVTLPLQWSSHGIKKGTVEMLVRLGDKVVARKEVKIESGDDLRESLTFNVPKGQGNSEESMKLSTTIQLKGSDLFKDSIEREVRVVDRKIRVLVIEHAPRFEYKFLQAALLRDKRIEPTFLLVNADPKVAQSGPPFLDEFPKQREKFFDARYNVIVLGDVAANYLSKEQLEWIKEFVANRGGLVVIAGRQHMPAEYTNTPLSEVLPVEFVSVKAKLPTDDRSPEYPPTLTDVGQRTEMLALGETADENEKIWKELPGFYGFYPVTKLRPGAQALIVNPRAKLDGEPMPVFATQYYGKGQVLFAGTDETWRWRANVENKHFVRFWGQILYQLGLPSLLGTSSSRVQMALDRSEAVLDRPGSIYVRLLDKDFNPRRDQQVEATLDYLDAKPGQERMKKVSLQAIVGREGEYQGFLTHEQPGRYELRVNNPDPATFSFRVELPPRHELEESGLDVRDLRNLAEPSGGKLYREEDLSKLPGDLRPQLAAFTRRQEILLWTPLMFLVFLGLITVEWVCRKLANLM